MFKIYRRDDGGICWSSFWSEFNEKVVQPLFGTAIVAIIAFFTFQGCNAEPTPKPTAEQEAAGPYAGEYNAVAGDLSLDIDPKALTATIRRGKTVVGVSSITADESKVTIRIPGHDKAISFSLEWHDQVEFLIPNESNDNRITFFAELEPDYEPPDPRPY